MAARLWWAGPVGSRHPPPRMAGASSFASTADRFGAHQPLCKCARRWHRVLASNALTGGTPSPGQALTKPGSSAGRHSMTFAAACALLAPRSAASVAPQNPGVRSGQRRSPFCRERAAARPRRPIPREKYVCLLVKPGVVRVSWWRLRCQVVAHMTHLGPERKQRYDQIVPYGKRGITCQ